jgi:riboflavin kinase/FMN adenylyltransferase
MRIPEGIHTFAGTVARGTRRGSTSGFPTINIPLDTSGVDGIFVATVGIEETYYPAAAFADPKRGILEAHMLNYRKELYGTAVTIVLLKKIREAKTFFDAEDMRRTIATDVKAVQDYFSQKL